MNITFNELRRIKDELPNGSMSKIAQSLGVDVETVRNYFGGANYKKGDVADIHFEQGPGGGIVKLDDTKILDMAKTIIDSSKPTGSLN